MDADAEKSTFTTMERVLYWFVIPIVFTAVLSGALLSLFDYDIKNQMLTFANKIPGIAAIVPEPKGVMKKTEPAPKSSESNSEGQTEDLKSAVQSLKKQLAEKVEELKTADAAYQQKDQALKELQEKNAALEEQLKEKGNKAADYDTQVQQTAAMYAKMLPSKSAPILENLTLKEQVLILSQMKVDDRVKILEKMDPKKAAQASIYLKDSVPAKDRQIAALQERLQWNDTATASKETRK